MNRRNVSQMKAQQAQGDYRLLQRMCKVASQWFLKTEKHSPMMYYLYKDLSVFILFAFSTGFYNLMARDTLTRHFWTAAPQVDHALHAQEDL